ncbi:Rv2629 family ribosome hibernation factor [Amycolatopsis alkalitolerans]|uniref:Peptide chain release factor 1 n=1 Tax=Amycolatopsis alkalitolerans TaxID=2547244 RepID=A0A5C4LY04_9PSEU|nr:Vms1/Ankzf1 family peptidyl-tRNA hydrolase [Amycolatopsis alkalitolerans]TNC23760.1 hypothetical protein FG385_20605 [Amycolatopsis alkalitolerans]
MDTSWLRPVTEADGPFASVHMDESHDTEDAMKQLDLRLREVETELAAQGADPQTVAAVVAAVRDSRPPAGKAGRGVIAARGSVLVNRRLAGPPATPEVRFSPLPYLVPLAVHTDEWPPYVVAAVDRVGAEIAEHGPGKPRTHVVRGADHPVHKVRGGGTAHREIQKHTEETTRQNLAETAREIAKTAERTAAAFVFLAGEVQSRSAVRELLPEALRPITVEVGTGDDRRIQEALTGHQLAGLDEVAAEFRAESGRTPGRAVAGLDAVTTALTEANVATLLVASPGDATVFTGRRPADVAVGKSGLDAPVARRADEALPFAAVATGADLAVLDERLDLWEGFGALLRHT